MEYNIYNCPHCNGEIVIYENEINCRIFRHGLHKSNNMQLNPHASKAECDQARIQGLIYGCGKPFRINEDNSIVICDYV